MCDESFAMTGIDCKRGTMGSSSQDGRGASSSLSCTRSDGHVCSRRCVSCFHLGFGADAICKKGVRMEERIVVPSSIALCPESVAPLPH